MAVELRGELPGASAHDRAVALAGAIAEMGVRRVALAPGAAGGWVELGARDTDLPGALLAALARAGEGEGAEVFCLDRPLRFEFGRERCVWLAGDALAAQEFGRVRTDSEPSRP